MSTLPIGPDSPPPVNEGSVAAGFGLGVGLTALQGLALWLVLASGAIPGNSGLTVLIVGLAGFGLIQLAYMVPVYLYLRMRKKTETAKGLLIEACLVLLVNVACWAIVYGK